MFNEKQLKNISKNIEILGRLFKESQRDIADAIGVGESTISNYVKGKMPPKRENLSKIAKHFNISENELINSDFSCLLETNEEDGIYSLMSLFFKNLNIIFPIININNNKEDKDFENAVNLNKKLYENFGKKNDSNILKIVELYFLSYEKYKNLDSYANIAMIIFIFCIPKKEEMSDYLDIYNLTNKKDLELLTKDCILTRFDDLESDLNNKVDSNDSSLLSSLDLITDKLSEDNKYKDFIYYFITLKYLFGVGTITDELPIEMCKLIGQEMLKNLVLTKNEYAINFIEKFTELLNFK